MEWRKIDATSAVVGVLAGSVLGLGAGYLLGRYVSKRSAEQEIEREVEAVRDHYRAKADAPGGHNYSGGSGATPPVGTAGRSFPGPRTDGSGHPWTVTRVPIDPDGEDKLDVDEANIYIDPYDDEDQDDDDDDDNGEDAELNPPENKKPKVYVISAEEFFNETNRNQKISITYFEADNTLTDDRKVPIPNPYQVCGNFKEGFGKDPANPHISYVRNERIHVDFEITMEEGTYAEGLNYGRPP